MSSGPPSRRAFPAWVPRRRGDGSGSEPPFEPSSWTGALAIMLGLCAVLWAVQIANDAHHYSWNRFGLKPRRIDGLWGIATQPMLHVSYGHLASNTVPFLGVGWVLLLSGLRSWLVVTGSVMLLSGAAAWLLAPSGVIVGVGSLTLGWIGYLVARAYFSRRLTWIVVAGCVLFFFGTFFFTLVPSFDKNVSWQSQACGLGAGIVTGALLHPRAARRHPGRRPGTPVVS